MLAVVVGRCGRLGGEGFLFAWLRWDGYLGKRYVRKIGPLSATITASCRSSGSQGSRGRASTLSDDRLRVYAAGLVDRSRRELAGAGLLVPSQHPSAVHSLAEEEACYGDDSETVS